MYLFALKVAIQLLLKMKNPHSFVLASDYAMDGGDWDYDVDLIEENVDEDEG